MTSRQIIYSDDQSETQSVTSTQINQKIKPKKQNEKKKIYFTPAKSRNVKRKNYDQTLSDKQYLQDSDQESDRTVTIKNNSHKKKENKQFVQSLKKKYPKKHTNFKAGTVTVENKGKSGKYQNVCPICLDSHSHIKGLLNCGHRFCNDCIQQWLKTSSNCPCCRAKFTQYIKVTQNQQKTIQLKRQFVKVQEKQMSYNEMDYFVCLQCNMGHDEDLLLICDLCEFYCCHVYCDQSLHNRFPTRQWYCKYCIANIRATQVQNRMQRNARVHNTSRQRPARRRQTPARSDRQTSVRFQTQISVTITQQQIYYEIDSDFDESQDSRSIQRAPRRQTRSSTRSKAYQIINNTQSIRRQVPQNSTAINLRNLRRRLRQ